VPGETRGLSLTYRLVLNNEAYAKFRSLCTEDEEFGKELLHLDFTSSIGKGDEEPDREGDEHNDDLVCSPDVIARQCLDGTPDEVDDLDPEADADFPEILVHLSANLSTFQG